MKRILVLAAGILALSACNDDADEDPTLAQYNADIRTIDNYLSENGISAEVDANTGIRYVVEEAGTGLLYYYNADSLQIDIKEEVLSTGEVYRDEDDVVVTSLINGAITALTKIQEGGKVTAYIPSFYAYGSAGTSKVEPNQVIKAELGLDSLFNNRMRNELDSIDNVLGREGITPLVHPTGIRYTINQGSGAQPTRSSSVTVNYAGRILGNVTDFDSGQSVTFSLSGLITGWQVMIPELKVGGSITMYLPSTFGYGRSGQGSIPANAILVFDIELLGTN